MQLEDRIFTFEPNLHKALWGEEHWVVSAHQAGPSIVANGRAKGQRLCDVLPGFPVLAKVIDAKVRLSVQVHPNEKTCLATGGEAKTEMWCGLSDGFIYAGLKQGIGPAEVVRAVEDGSFEDVLVRHEIHAGDVFFIPGGTVHSIGDGTCLYEVQQSSNTTFRLYDWGRVGADGNPRELHVGKALAALDYNLPPPERTDSAHCDFFDFRKVRLDGEATIPGAGWTILYVFRGVVTLCGTEYPEGSSVLVLDGDDFHICGKGEVFVTKR